MQLLQSPAFNPSGIRFSLSSLELELDSTRIYTDVFIVMLNLTMDFAAEAKCWAVCKVV